MLKFIAPLLAVLVLHVAHDHAVFERRAAKQQRGDGKQRIEPAAGLVDGLGDEVRRERLQCHWAKGMEPESYQQSMTSGVLCISLPHFSQVMVTWSM